MPDNLTTFAPAKKEVYEGIVNETLNNRSQLFGWFDKVPMDGGGPVANLNTGALGVTTQRAVHFTSHIGRSGSGGYQDAEANFPTSANQNYVSGYVQGRTMYWPATVSRALIATTRTDEAAFARAMVEAAVRTGNDLRVHQDMVIAGDGSGTMGTISGAGTFNAATPVANSITLPLDNFQDLRRFQIGQIVAVFGNAGTPALSRTSNGSTQIAFGAGATINNAGRVAAITVSQTAPAIHVVALSGTFSGLGTAVAGGFVIVKMSADLSQALTTVTVGERTASVRFGPCGIDGMVLDCDSPMEAAGTPTGYLGILAPATYGSTGGVNTQGAGGAVNGAGFPQWSSFVNRSSTPRPLSDALLQSIIDMPMISYGERPTLITTSYGGRWEFANSKLGIRRYVNTTDISGSTGGGFKENESSRQFPTYDDIPIVPSRFGATWNFQQSGNLVTNYYALNLNVIKWFQWYPTKIMDDDGLTWRMIQRTPFFECIFESCGELMTFARNAHAKAINVTANDFGA